MRIKLKIKKGLVGLLTAGLISIGTSKANDKDINKFSTEITYTTNKHIIKFRPFDYTSGIQENHLMLGKKFKDFTIYCYWKADSKDRNWIGARIDCDKKTLDDKLRGNLQLRFFKGLDETRDQIYFIPSFDYKIGSSNIGILGYGVKSSGKKAFFYVGPQAGIKLSNHLSMIGVYGKDIFSDTNLVYWKTNFTFGNK